MCARIKWKKGEKKDTTWSKKKKNKVGAEENERVKTKEGNGYGQREVGEEKYKSGKMDDDERLVSGAETGE